MSNVFVNLIQNAINNVSDPKDREAIVQWLIEARGILDSDQSTAAKAQALYANMNTMSVVGGFFRSIAATLKNYATSDLPLPIKVAMPVGLAALAAFGSQGAGIAAFGSAIGVPVVLLIFLGSAGITAIIEPFVSDDPKYQDIKEPLADLLITIAQLETDRRINQQLAAALREQAKLPQAAILSGHDIKLQQELLALSPLQFEQHIMSFFQAAGYVAGVTAASNDYGVDGWAKFPNGLAIVQCKRYAPNNKVGRPDIQQFKGVLEEQKAAYAYFVTTSSYTHEAINSAALNPKLKLIDMFDLYTWHRWGKAQL